MAKFDIQKYEEESNQYAKSLDDLCIKYGVSEENLHAFEMELCDIMPHIMNSELLAYGLDGYSDAEDLMTDYKLPTISNEEAARRKGASILYADALNIANDESGWIYGVWRITLENYVTGDTTLYSFDVDFKKDRNYYDRIVGFANALKENGIENPEYYRVVAMAYPGR